MNVEKTLNFFDKITLDIDFARFGVHLNMVFSNRIILEESKNFFSKHTDITLNTFDFCADAGVLNLLVHGPVAVGCLLDGV